MCYNCVLYDREEGHLSIIIFVPGFRKRGQWILQCPDDRTGPHTQLSYGDSKTQGEGGPLRELWGRIQAQWQGFEEFMIAFPFILTFSVLSQKVVMEVNSRRYVKSDAEMLHEVLRGLISKVAQTSISHFCWVISNRKIELYCKKIKLFWQCGNFLLQ